jgi:hypothetical protein
MEDRISYSLNSIGQSRSWGIHEHSTYVEFPRFHRRRRSVTFFLEAPSSYILSLFWVTWMHPHSHNTLKIKFNIILPSMLGHANGLINSRVPIKMLFVFLICKLHAPPLLFSVIWLLRKYLKKCIIYELLHYVIFLSLNLHHLLG